MPSRAAAVGSAWCACTGILRLARRYGSVRLEAACDRGLDIGARSYGSIQSILKHGLDRPPPPPAAQGELLPDHPTIRGSPYYHCGGLIVPTHPTLHQMHQLRPSRMARAFT